MTVTRQPAVRVPAEEILDTTAFFKPSEKERYAITPLGRRVSRVVIAGVLTLKTETKPGSGIYKAVVCDGVRSISCFASERFNPEVVATLNDIKEPAWVVVIGKVRPIQSQKTKRIIPIIRIEHIRPVDKIDVMMWRLEVIKALKEQIDAYKRDATEEVKIAKEHYGEIDVGKYEKLINDLFDKVREELTLDIAIPKAEKPTEEKAEENVEEEDQQEDIIGEEEEELVFEEDEFDLTEILSD